MKLRVGRVRGIALEVKASWLLIFALVTYTLGNGYYRVLFPNWAPAVVWSFSLLASLLFFVCVVLHELGHALLAQRNGITVEAITLFLFGGVARMRREPSTPQAELQVALAGPLVSLLLTILCGLGYWYSGGMTASSLGATSTYLALINALVFFFNMVPGFPLDGGRVLRALAWYHSGDLFRATHLATTSGYGFGILLIVCGFALGLFNSLFNGFWFVLVGWFLVDAARSARARSVSQSILTGMPLARAVATDANGALDEDTSIQSLVDTRLGYNNPTPVPVLQNGRITGIVGVPEIQKISPALWPTTAVRNVMVPLETHPTAAGDQDAWETLIHMVDENMEWLVVMEQGEFLGTVSPRQLLQFAQAQGVPAG
ncbi:MAG TPA: site-2 protease family protein [Armatimonadota bacterium]|nr:site-2 protease family protein [Armatimonadota bacterium]